MMMIRMTEVWYAHYVTDRVTDQYSPGDESVHVSLARVVSVERQCTEPIV